MHSTKVTSHNTTFTESNITFRKVTSHKIQIIRHSLKITLCKMLFIRHSLKVTLYSLKFDTYDVIHHTFNESNTQ